MAPEQTRKHVHIVGLSYVSLYFSDLDRAVAFHSAIFCPPTSVDDEKDIYGWRLGATWLTLLPSKIGTAPDGNPRNTEFAIQVSSPADVDRFYQELLQAGAKTCMPPDDTKMYEPMRFACVDDPFGVRIDVYCPR